MMRRFVVLAVLWMLSACAEQPKRHVQAVVVSIAPHPNPKYDPDEVVVTARSLDGAYGSQPVPQARLSCRVGDVLPASARGVALTFDARACEQ